MPEPSKKEISLWRRAILYIQSYLQQKIPRPKFTFYPQAQRQRKWTVNIAKQNYQWYISIDNVVYKTTRRRTSIHITTRTNRNELSDTIPLTTKIRRTAWHFGPFFLHRPRTDNTRQPEYCDILCSDGSLRYGEGSYGAFTVKKSNRGEIITKFSGKLNGNPGT